MPGADAHRRVSVQRCKHCANPHDHGDMPKYLQAGLTQYVLNNFSKKSPPYHVTHKTTFRLLFRDSKWRRSPDTNHRFVVEARGRGGVIAVMYETHWMGLSRPSWEREKDLQLSGRETLCYWAGTPNQHRQTNRLYRRMRIDVAQRELFRVTVSVSLHPATAAFRTQGGLAATALRCFPTEPTFATRATTVCGDLGRSARARLRMWYIWCALWMTRDRSSFLFSRPQLDFDGSRTRFLVSTSTLS